METFAKLFGSLLVFCISVLRPGRHLGPFAFAHPTREHRPLLLRRSSGANHRQRLLRQPTNDYHRWVEAFANKRKISLQWGGKGVRKEDYVHPDLRRMERRKQFGVSFILKSMEVGPSFRSTVPRFPVKIPASAAMLAVLARGLHQEKWSGGAKR
jgi:hypothetical protein